MKTLFHTGTDLKEFTAENFSNHLQNLAEKYQEPKTDEEHKLIELRYKKQLNINVKSYHNGTSNIVEFI